MQEVGGPQLKKADRHYYNRWRALPARQGCRYWLAYEPLGGNKPLMPRPCVLVRVYLGVIVYF